MKRVIIVGGGAAGMMAAVAAAGRGRQVCLIEKKRKVGEEAFYYRQGALQCDKCCGYGDPFGKCLYQSEIFVQRLLQL